MQKLVGTLWAEVKPYHAVAWNKSPLEPQQTPLEGMHHSLEPKQLPLLPVRTALEFMWPPAEDLQGTAFQDLEV
jgi:hypothetical protein